MNFMKNFDRARSLAKGCLFGAMGLCILGLLIIESMPQFAI